MKSQLYTFFKWSEKYTKTDSIYVIKNMSFLGGGQIISAFITLVFAIFIADILPKEEYGNYKYILSTVALVNSIAFTGLAPALVRAIASGYDGTLKEFAKINLLWSLIPASFLTIGSIYYYANENIWLSIGLLAGGLTLPFIERGEMYASVLNGKKIFGLLSLASIIRNGIPTFLVGLVAYLTFNPLLMAITYFVTTSIILNVFYYYTVYKFIQNEITDPEAMHLAKHSSFINVLALISDQLDNILIFQFVGGSALAIYNFAEAIPNVIQGIVKQIGVIATPKFVKQEVRDVQKHIFSKTLLLFIFTLPIVIMYVVLAPYIFQILFPKYLESVIYSQTIVLGILISSSIALAFLDSQKAIKQKYQLSLVSNLTKIPILIFGCYFYGIWGIIFGKLISKVIGMITSLYLVKKI